MEIFKEFGLNPILIAANIVNFAILLFLLKKFLYQPALKVLEERKTKIAQSLKSAEEIEQRLAKTAEEQEKLLKKANQEAALIVADAGKQAKELLEETRLHARKMGEEMMASTKQALGAEKEKMIHEIKEESADLIVSALSKITGKVLNESDQKKLAKEAQKEMTS